MCLCTLIPFKQVLFNSNVPFHIQITQIMPSLILVYLSTPNKPSSTQMCFCTLKSLKPSFAQLKCAFATQITQMKPS